MPRLCCLSRLLPRPFALALSFVALGPTACAPTVAELPPLKLTEAIDPPPPARAPKPTAEEEAQAKTLALKAQHLSRRGHNVDAERHVEQIIASYAGTQVGRAVLLSRAQLAARAGRPAESAKRFEQLLSAHPDAPEAPSWRETYASQLVVLGRMPEATALIKHLYDTAPPGPAQARLAQTLSEAWIRAGSAADAVEIEVAEAARAQTPERAQTWRDHADSLIATTLGISDLERLAHAHDKERAWDPYLPGILFRLSQLHYQAHDYPLAESALSNLTTRFPNSAHAAAATDFGRILHSRFEVNPRAVGVILPLSGKFKQYGERSLRAIELAFRQAPGLELVVRDSAGDANQAAAMVEDLVATAHVVAVLGPLFSNEALSAAQKAESLGVPLLCLSHREGLSELGSFIFRTALTVRAQAEALAKTAFEDLHMTKFAILYPRSRYGTDFAMAFWDEVIRRHGQIRGVESYALDQTTFREPVRRLIGRWFLNARPEYQELFTTLKGQDLPPLRLRAELAKLDKSLAPIVDFEGLVVPDSGRQLGLIAPALAFEDVALSHDTRALERLGKITGQTKLTPLTLLGGSTLNSAQTLESCDQYCEDAVFVDAFFGGSTSLLVRDFVSKYRDLAGSDPFLSEAQAFDTASLVAKVLASKEASLTRLALRDALVAMAPYSGVTGVMHFDAQGELQKKLTVLTIHNRRILELGVPPA